jgi:DNA-binding NarL/FixJ family response regulator
VTQTQNKLLYVEDNPEVADAVRTRFSRERRFDWLGVLPTAERLIDRVRETHPDVVILDLDLPGPSAISMLRLLSDISDRPRVLIFSGQVNHAMIDAAIQAGAWGYVSKNDGEDAIVHAVDRVVDDEFILSAEVREVYGQH